MINIKGKSALSYFVFLIVCMSCASEKRPTPLRLNQIQVIGSHNSYKQKIEPPVMELILGRNPDAVGLDYYHLPIHEQLDLGLRGLEIDVLHDPAGGRYRNPVALTLVRNQGKETMTYDSLDQLGKPGLKVLHVPDIDFRTHCYRFVDCLLEVKKWSENHRDHLPVFITINPKESGVDEPGFTTVLPFTSAVLDSLNQEIRSVFDDSMLITPASVRGESASLREAILKQGWPELTACRGKVLFVLDAGKEVTDRYTALPTTNKPMFVNVPEDHDDAAFLIMNNPVKQKADIMRLVKQGFMVRTRADADTREARATDYTRLPAAMASGAHLLSTDYYRAQLSPTGTFEITLNGKYEVCNPVTSSTNDCDL